jgi:hypothetical protein
LHAEYQPQEPWGTLDKKAQPQAADKNQTYFFNLQCEIYETNALRERERERETQRARDWGVLYIQKEKEKAQ